MKEEQQLQSLQNATSKIEGLEVYLRCQPDKRKRIPKFNCTYNGASCSPVLDYNDMQHYLLGFNRALILNDIIKPY
jgi:hypothetical protein